MRWLRLVGLLGAIALVAWSHGRLGELRLSPSSPLDLRWQAAHADWHRMLAGPVPGLAADMAILEVFNLYDGAKDSQGALRQAWWHQLSYQLHRALALDPRFHDAYRLTEGLLAYEPGFTADAVELIEQHAPMLDSGEYPLVASFLAWHELHDRARALRLARIASEKPDTAAFAAGFAAQLIRRDKGCRAAMSFLRMRARVAQGLSRRHQCGY